MSAARGFHGDFMEIEGRASLAPALLHQHE
jgi:hypothetical protein